MTSNLENNIKPKKIFSIELFWREIYSAYRFNNALKIGDKNIFDVYTGLMDKYIKNNQPFELIDGDGLEIPQKAMEEVFKDFDKCCLVLAILG